MSNNAMGEIPRRVRTYSGIFINPLDPQPASIRIDDIARGLSNVCRYAGQCRFHYSVAQHSIHIVEELERQGAERDVIVSALLHDASEAYLGDVPKPLKVQPEYEAYRVCEKRLQDVIYARFFIPGEFPIVKELDVNIWGNEVPVLFPGETAIHDRKIEKLTITKWSPDQAYEMFMIVAGQYGLLKLDVSV